MTGIRISGASFSYAGVISASDPYDRASKPVEVSAPAAAVQDASLCCLPGSVTLLCGASGSGKTTLLQMINGLVPGFRHGTLTGEVMVAGRDMSSADLAEVGTIVATVFQNPRSQFFCGDVRAELALCGENYGIEPTVIAERVKAAGERLGILHLFGKPIAKLSGGEQQKVAAASAIAADTGIILFDEPTSNLSPAAIDEFVNLIRELKKSGRTIVISEHRVSWLAGLVDQVLLLSAGKIIGRFSGDDFFAQSDSARRRLGLRSLVPVNLTLTSESAGSGKDEGVTLRNVRYSYEKRRVLSIDELRFPRGTVSAVVGENGVGKSTLTRLICGLAKPESGGCILFDGVPVSEKIRLRQSAVVLQDVHRQLFSGSVLSEVALGRDPGRTDTRTAAEILDEFDLAEFSERHPLSLSGGQKQRLVISSAVASDKKVLIFDEPTSGVDYTHLQVIAGRLQQLARDGAVVLVITHDLELVHACADRVIQLNRLVENAGPQATVHTCAPPDDGGRDNVDAEVEE